MHSSMSGSVKRQRVLQSREFLSYLATLNYSIKTIRSYRFLLDSFIDSGLSPLEYVDRKGISPTTRNKEIEMLRKYYSYLGKRGLTNLDPTENIEKSRTPSKAPVTVNMKTMNHIIDSIDGKDFTSLRDRALLEISVAIAARTGDFDRLMLGDVDLEFGLIKVFGKGSKESVQNLSQAAIAAIKDYLPERAKIAKCDHLFVNQYGQQLRAIYYVFKKYLGDIKPHDFNRHSMALIMMRNGMQLHELRDFMRHDNIKTTSRYLQLTKEDVKTAFNNAHPRN